MSILGKKQDDNEDDDLGGETVDIPLHDLVCPTCGRDLAPWVEACPADGATPVDRAETMLQGVPDIPLHLLQGLYDESGPDGADTGSDERPDADREEGDAG